jgi:putative flippase GtrA
MKFINKELLLFVLYGGINTLLGYGIYVFLMLFFSYKLSYTISYVLGIFISYYLNSKFVFKRKLSLTKALQYPLVYFTQYIVGILLLQILVEALNFSKLLAPIIIPLITVPLTYLVSRFIIKKK